MKTNILNEMRIEFGRLVREQRIKKGFTQTLAADNIQISVYKLRNVELARTSCSWKLCLRICFLFEIDILDFDNKYIRDYILQVVRNNPNLWGKNKSLLCDIESSFCNNAESKIHYGIGKNIFDYSFVE